MNGMAMAELDEAETGTAATAVGVFEVLSSRGQLRAAMLQNGALVRVSPADPMAVWPVQQATMLVIEEYALPPAEMQLRVHTSCGQVLRLRGEVTDDGLLTLLRLESALTLG